MQAQVLKHYWVTGASSGIGRELTLQLARAGHKVYASSRDQQALQALHTQFPDKVIPLCCDVSNDLAMQDPFSNLPAATRPAKLDGVLMSAGCCEYVDLPVLDTALVRRVTEVNFFGVVNTSRAALPLLKAAAGEGRQYKPELIGICSMSVYTGFPRAEAYGASKAAMRYFLESLRCDVQLEMDVTVVYPGFVATPMTGSNDFPMPWCMTAETAASRIIRSLGKGKRSIHFPWQLHWLLSLARLTQGFWYAVMVPRLSRQRKSVVQNAEGNRS